MKVGPIPFYFWTWASSQFTTVLLKSIREQVKEGGEDGDGVYILLNA